MVCISPSVQVCGTLEGTGDGEEFAILQQHADSLDESLCAVLREIEQLREKWAENQAAVREQKSRVSRLGAERDRLAAEIEALQERISGLEHLLEERDGKVGTLTLQGACGRTSESVIPLPRRMQTSRTTSANSSLSCSALAVTMTRP